MAKSGTICDPTVVNKFLEDDLLASEAKEFESHLDSCEACRNLLAKKAAGDSWWNEVRESLHDEEGDTTGDLSDVLSFLNPSDNPRMLGRFGGYEIAGLIGQGGMGIVLKGFDESLNRYAAIKVLAPQLATRGSARNRFAREAQAAAAVVHENVIAIHGVSESAGLPFLVMPYVRGESLQKRLDRDGPMSPTEIVRIAFQVAAGLAAANKQGLVHRDIKPANILLPEGVQRVLITDFGLARAVDDSHLTRTGTIAGTPQFMSPEQARGDIVDPRSDLFSLGTVIYAMCTGHSPFRASNPYGVLRRIIEDTPRSIREINPRIPNWLEAIVTKLHAKSPDERYQSASELAELLEQCLAHLQNPGGELPGQLQAKPKLSASPAFKMILPVGLLVALLGSWSLMGPLFQRDNTPDENPSHVQAPGDSVYPSNSESTANSLIGTMLADHAASLPQDEELTAEQKAFREKLFRLNERLEELRAEGRFLESLAVEKEILLQLKLHDKDHERLSDLRELMIDHRIKGQHGKADQVVSEIRQVELGLLDRYRQLKQIDAMEAKALARLEPVLKKIEQAVARKQKEALDELSKEQEMIVRELEAEYHGQIASDSSLNENVDEAFDAQIAYHEAASELENARASLAHSTKLAAKGFITEEQLKADETAVEIASLKMEKASNRLRRFGDLILSRKSNSDPLLTTNPLTHEGNVIESLKQTITAAELTLEEMLTVYGNQHPRVLALQKRLDHWKEELRLRGEKNSKGEKD